MSDKCTHENLTWMASVDVWKCSDCMAGLTKQEVIYLKSKQLKETQEQLEALKADKAKVEADKTCTWELDSNADWEVWETSCGSSWCFEGESDLKEHGVKFCQSCGGRIIDASTLEQKEDK